MLWRRPSDRSNLAEVLILEGKPKICKVRSARSIEENICWLEIPMDQTPGVSVMQRLGYRRNEFAP